MSDAKPSISIPDDLEACRALIEQQVCMIEELHEKKQKLEQEKEELRLAMAELLQRMFRRRSERYLSDPNQLRLDFGDTDDATDAAEGLALAVDESRQTIAEHTRRRPRKPRREKLPDHLPRYEVVVEAPEDVRNCPVHGPREPIGYDVVETLEFERPKLRVRVTKYPKYACKGSSECGVASPERPTGLVEGNRYDTSVAAEVITGKYAYHLPVYREQDYFAGSGWTASRSTLLNLLAASAFVIRPLVEYFKQEVLGSGVVGTDETRVTLLLPKEVPKKDADDPRSVRRHEVFSKAMAEGKPSVSARMWAYRSVTVPLNVFDFTVSRHRDGPEMFFENFSGTLLGDCYSGFEAIAVGSSGRIDRAACNAHARRKVFEARESYPREASVVLAKYQQLYDIEDRAKSMSHDARRALRQAEAVPVWESLGAWLASDDAQRVLPKSTFAKALGYIRNHWDPLRLYLTEGRIPIDNNEVEQLMKQVALGRKNWLFVGSVAAGERAADFFTLVTSAVRNDLDVWAYVKNVLDRLLAGSTDYASLRPEVWQQSHPEAVRQYRLAERRDRADRKQRRRTRRRLGK